MNGDLWLWEKTDDQVHSDEMPDICTFPTKATVWESTAEGGHLHVYATQFSEIRHIERWPHMCTCDATQHKHGGEMMIAQMSPVLRDEFDDLLEEVMARATTCEWRWCLRSCLPRQVMVVGGQASERCGWADK